MSNNDFSSISGFYRLSVPDRRQRIVELKQLSEQDVATLDESTTVLENAGQGYYVENVIGVMQIPLGIATNFKVNGKDVLVPMAIEEASVIAAASNSAKVARVKGGFTTSNTGPIMIGQIQLVGIPDPWNAREIILEHSSEIIDIANEQDPVLVKFGGGCKELRVKVLQTTTGPMVIVELIVDCRDAMGANAVNTMNEACAPRLEELTGGRVLLRIISNLADNRLARARAVFPAEELKTEYMSGEEVVDGILQAQAFAESDPYRCATHNKGIMNGIDAVALATAQDWRAIEAGAHTYAATKNPCTYSSLTTWEKNVDGDLVGTIELPLAVGLVGGVARIHPVAQISFKILDLKIPGGATRLAEIMASVGLAQNFGALRALATVGIQAGHMKLHCRNLAASAGANPEEIERIVEAIVDRKMKVTFDNVESILKEIRSG